MKYLFVSKLVLLGLILGAANLWADGSGPELPQVNPAGETGALKPQVVTAGSYDAHSGNATRIVTDLKLPGALGEYGLDFTRYWNSLHNDDYNPDADRSQDFGDSGWSHSWKWTATYGTDVYQEQEGGGEQGRIIYVTSITITFPDGSAKQYKLFRSNIPFYGQSASCVNPSWGEPYSPQCGETEEWSDPGIVDDHLRDMAVDGSQFWLVRGDGGSVRFELVGDRYLAKDVYDPHGFRTELRYTTAGYLYQVVQDGGRTLNVTWGSFPVVGWVITRVESAGPAGSQFVTYKYSGLGGFRVLTKVEYQNQPTLGQTASAIYSYEHPAFSRSPVLRQASDPHFAGPMANIRYSYRGEACEVGQQPPTHPASAKWNYFYARVEAIASERSSGYLDPNNQPVLVSAFAIDCWGGTRTEENGLYGRRTFYYGRSGGDNNNLGYRLSKLTDFYPANTLPPANLPFRRQVGGERPTSVWDGRNILTQIRQWVSGHPGEYLYIDQSTSTYNWTNPGQSQNPDPAYIHPSPYKHWLFSKKDENDNVTTYIRDQRRRVTRIVYQDTSYEEYSYNDLNQVLTHRMPSGVVLHYDYDQHNRLLREWNEADGEGEATTYTYDALERVATVRNPRAVASNVAFSARMTYNGWHQVTSVEYPSTDGISHPTVRYEYDSYSNCTAIIDELGHRKDYTYDAYRRCTSLTEQVNGPGADCNNVATRRWDWVYDRVIEGVGQFGASAHTSKEWRIQVEPVFNQDGQRRMTARYHDVNNRLTAETTGLIATSLTTGQNGPDTETHRFTYDENGQKKTYTDPRGRITTYDYDNRNRLWKTNETINTIARTTKTLYDRAGNKTEVEFPDGKKQKWPAYNAFGQPRVFIDEREQTTNLDYWPWGPMKKLSQVTTHRRNDGGAWEHQETKFYYDLMGRPQTTIFPDTTREISTYRFGQLDSFKTRRNQTKWPHYDARDYHTWENGAAPGITRVWDDANRLTRISNTFAVIDYGYDDAGQAKWEGNYIAGSPGRTETRYCHYPSGEVARLTYPNGTVIDRNYTARGQLKGVGWGSGSTSYAYLHDGKVDYQAWQHGEFTKWEYNGRGMIESIQHKKTAAGPDLAYRRYWRDNRDRIEAWKRGTDNSQNWMEDGRGDRYRYDAEGQLIEASYRVANPESSPGPALRADVFSYDEMGNRVRWNHIASRGWMDLKRRDNGLNQYREWENNIPAPDPNHWGSGIFHDDNIPPNPSPPPHPFVPPGNGVVMQDGYITGGFNALNQPVAIWSFAYWNTPNWMFFGYDPLGRCVKRWVGSSGSPATNPATYFYYDGWNLIQEGPGGGTVDRVYVHGGRVDEIVASQAGGQWVYHHYDARGHCILLTDTNGLIREQYDYDAFGRPYFYDRWGNDIGSSLWGNRFLFTGREWIKDLKLYDYRNRMYQPELGRFLQPDPKQFEAGDYNLYRYCHNDPINKSDPLGLVDVSYTPDQARFAEQLKWEPTYNPKSTFTVAGHSDSNGFKNASGDYIRMDKVVGDITGNKNFDPDKPITLIGCEAGKGDNPFAQRLAQALADKTGTSIRVIAPTTEVAQGEKPGSAPRILPHFKPDAARRTGDDRYDKSKPGQSIQFTAKPRKDE